MSRIGILGGTFNPIHIGHLMLAEWAADAAILDQVWLIPAGTPCWKTDETILPASQRLQMVKLALDGNHKLKCMDLEVRKEGYSYSYETMEALKQQFPEHHFYFIVGSGCLFTLENWKCPERLFQSCTILAACRGNTPFRELELKRAQLLERFQGDILLMRFPDLSLSSTEIRERIKNHESVKYMVPDKVIQYIREKRCYYE